MARKPTIPEPQSARLSQQDIGRGIRRLERQLEAVRNFNPATLDRKDPYSTTRPLGESIETALTETFGHDTVEYFRFRRAARFEWPISMIRETPHEEKVQAVSQARTASIQLLEAALSLLHERQSDWEDEVAVVDNKSLVGTSQRIFIVHGHDNEPKEAAARFLQKLGLDPIILHEQANKGRTIIQKFRDEAADVGFALVLMTPDDEVAGGARRARQNVILELGFFLGALGPDRVAAIVKGDVERPSDFDGVVYIPFDAGWKVAVSKELEAAGYTVDWNVVMKQ